MMNCQELSINLSRYLDGEMPPDELQRCQDHLGACQACLCELQSLQNVSKAMQCCCSEEVNLPTWDSVSERLTELEAVENQTAGSETFVHDQLRSASRRGWLAPLFGVGMALAATLGLMLLSQVKPTVDPHSIAVDFSEVIDRTGNDPAAALVQLNQQFAGRTVEAGQVESLLGYRPVALTDLPRDVSVVSTSVLKLPVCICPAGKCTCRPGGCNCAAIMCQRQDGSQLLMLEHCESDKVELSKQPARLVQGSSNRVQLYGSKQRLTASWTVNDHRLTAIGLKDEREAQQLAMAY